jgi:glutamine synthetase
METKTLSLDHKIQSLQEKLTSQGVKYCVGAYVDLHGVPKGKVVPIEHFGHFARGSELYTGYALDGLGQSPNDDEISSVPDLDRIMILPWKREVAWYQQITNLKGNRTKLALELLCGRCFGKPPNWVLA